MSTASVDEVGRRSAPASELIRSLVADVGLLIRREAELASIELKDKAAKAGAAIGLMVAGGVVAFFGVATLVAASVLALAIVLPAWASALIVAVALFVVAAVLALVGRARMRTATPLAPRRSIAAAQEDIAWMRHKTEQLKAFE
jgi:VIT1/CCC1 family predicted Fe2+/Mn2+ transporter